MIILKWLLRGILGSTLFDLFFNFSLDNIAIDEKKGKRKKDWRLKAGCKYYYFNKYGRDTGMIVFTCIARSYTNAIRKFNNFKAIQV